MGCQRSQVESIIQGKHHLLAQTTVAHCRTLHGTKASLLSTCQGAPRGNVPKPFPRDRQESHPPWEEGTGNSLPLLFMRSCPCEVVEGAGWGPGDRGGVW